MIDGIPFFVGGDTRRRDPPNPVRGALPCADRTFIVDAYRPLAVNDLPSTLGHLPLKRQASQALSRRSWPDEPPKVLIATRTLALLNTCRHFLEFRPRLR